MTPDNLLLLLSTAQGRADQGPNRALAEKLISGNDHQRLGLLISYLKNTIDKKSKNDILLCLAHLSSIAPGMLTPHVDSLVPFLNSKENRAVWATMIILSNMTPLITDKLYTLLPTIVDKIEHGTVVTKDHGMDILIGLYQVPMYREDAFDLFCEQLLNAPDNQLGQYGEKISRVITPSDTSRVIDILEGRLPELVKESHQKRISKLIRNLQIPT